MWHLLGSGIFRNREKFDGALWGEERVVAYEERIGGFHQTAPEYGIEWRCRRSEANRGNTAFGEVFFQTRSPLWMRAITQPRIGETAAPSAAWVNP